MADQDDELDNGADIDSEIASNDGPPVGVSSLKLDAPSASSSMNPALQEYLQNKQQLASAQQESRRNEMLTGLARASASLSAGLAHSNVPVNEAPFNAMAATDQQPVTDVLNAQKSQAADLSNQQALMATQKQAGDSDPNSPQSIAAKNLIKRLYPGKFDDATLDSLSAADVGNSIMKPLELDQKINEHKDEMASKAADRKENAATRADAKSTADQNKAYTDLVQKAESARSNQAVQQAQLAIQNASRALKLADSGKPVSRQDLALLAEEMGKIATGGVPSDHGVQSLMPDNLQTRLAKLKEFLTNNPTDAEAAEYVKRNISYLHDMTDVSNDTLKNYHRNLLNGYKDRIGESQRAEYEKTYHLDNNDQAAISSPAGQDHAARAADILAKRQAAKSAQAPAVPIPNYAAPAGPPQPSPLLPQPPPAANVAQEGYAYGGIVQPPGFQHVRQPLAPKLPMMKPMHAPRSPKEMMPAMDKAMTQPAHFACGGEVHSYKQGGTVPGQPNVPFDSPVNDTVNAKLTPKEEVLPLSITQSKTPALAAYLHMKMRGYK